MRNYERIHSARLQTNFPFSYTEIHNLLSVPYHLETFFTLSISNEHGKIPGHDYSYLNYRETPRIFPREAYSHVSSRSISCVHNNIPS